MTQKKIDEWEKATPENIPERVMTKKAFLQGFYKRAAETFMAPASPDTGEHGRALLWNEAGGVDPRTPEDLDVAASVGLMTLPKEETGASCSNCVYFRMLDPALGAGFCTNPQVKQDVTVRMLCSVWENEGAHRPYDDVGSELPAGRPATDVLEQDPTGLAGQIMGDMQSGAPAEAPMEEGVEDTEAFDRGPAPAGEQQATGADSDNTGTPRQETQSAPKPDKKKDSEKKDKPKSTKADGHTINVNIGDEKKASALGAALSEKQAANIHMILKRLGKLKKGTSVEAYLKRRRR